MRFKRYDLDLPDVDDNGIAESQTTAGAAAVVLNGTLCDSGTAAQFDIGDSYSSDVGGVQIAVVSGGDIATIVFTVTGSDADGIAQTETITGVNNSTVEGTVYWSQITSIATSAAAGSAFTIGTVDEVVSRTIGLDARSMMAAAIMVNVTGTMNFTVEQTLENINQSSTFSPQQSAFWNAVSAAGTADLAASATVGATAIRLKVNSYSSGAEAQMMVSQAHSR